MLVSLFLLSFKGLNYGVDFKGGTIIELRTNDNSLTISKLRQSFFKNESWRYICKRVWQKLMII